MRVILTYRYMHFRQNIQYQQGANCQSWCWLPHLEEFGMAASRRVWHGCILALGLEF